MDFWKIIREFLNFELFYFNQYSFKVVNILLILLTVAFTKLFLKGIAKWLDVKVRRKELDVGNRFAILQITSYVVWTIVIVLIMEGLGINVTILVAGSAALLVGIGLGLQSVFMDFISGIVLLIEGDNKINDIIEFDGKMGIIKKVGIRTSEIITFNDTVLVVPNSKLINNIVTNWSHTDKTARYMVQVGVSYDSNPEKVRSILLDCVHQDTRILKSPAPLVRLADFGDSALIFHIFFWTNDLLNYENIRSDLRFRIFEAFKREGIHIPFPQRVLHIANDNTTSHDFRVNH